MVAADHFSKSSESAKNMVVLNSHMLATISRGSKFLLEKLQKECHQQEKEGRKTSAKDALQWLAKTLKDCNEELSIGILIAAWNESDCELYCINGKGKVVKDKILSTGSGSEFARSLLDDHPLLSCKRPKQRTYNLRHKGRKCKMSIIEAAEWAKSAICVAASMAPQNGDTVTVYHVGSGGCKKLSEDDFEEWQKANHKSAWLKYEVIGKGW